MPAIGGGVSAPGELALRVWLTPSGDDPSVVLRFDTFEPPETFGHGLARLDALLRGA